MTCCCTPGCDIFTDLFTRADSPTVDGWTVEHGTWEIDTNSLRTSSPSASIIPDTGHPDASGEGYVKASFNAHTNDKIRLLIDWLDDSNYHFAQITVSTNGCIELYRRSGGTNTLLTRNIINVDYTTTLIPELYFGEGYITVVLNGTKICKRTTTVGGNKAGVGTDTVVGEVTIDDFYYKRYYSSPDYTSCPRITCSTSCTIQADSFDRSDNTDIGCVWEEVSGDFEIKSNTLRTSSSDSVAKCLTANPEDGYSGYVAAYIYGYDGDKIRLLIDYVDAGNYHYAQFTIGSSGCIELYRNSELLSKKQCSITASSLVLAKLYLGDGYLTAEILGVSLCHKISYIGGKYAGLGTGAVSSEVRFDGFTYQFYYDATDHPTCPQTSCTSGGCTIDSDSFDRADSSNVGCDWYEYNGSWRIEGNTLKTSSDNASIQYLHAQPEGIASYHVALDVVFAYSTATRILLDFNGGNYIYAEISFTGPPVYIMVPPINGDDDGIRLSEDSAGCLAIYDQTGKVLDAKQISLPGTTFNFEAGLSNGTFYAFGSQGLNDRGAYVCYSPKTGTSKYVGIGTGALNGGEISILGFSFYRGNTEDFDCNNNTCANSCGWGGPGLEYGYWGPINCIFDAFIGTWTLAPERTYNPPWGYKTSSSNALLIHKVSNPGGNNIYITGKVNIGAYASEAIIAYNYNTTTHTYDYVKITSNSAASYVWDDCVRQEIPTFDGKIQVYSGGSVIAEETHIDINPYAVQCAPGCGASDALQEYSFSLCVGKSHYHHGSPVIYAYGDEIISFFCAGVGVDAIAPYQCSSANKRSFALGTGTTSGTIRFYGFSQSQAMTNETESYGCGPCVPACGFCKNASTPDTITLDFSGIYDCIIGTPGTLLYDTMIIGQSFELQRNYPKTLANWGSSTCPGGTSTGGSDPDVYWHYPDRCSYSIITNERWVPFTYSAPCGGTTVYVHRFDVKIIAYFTYDYTTDETYLSISVQVEQGTTTGPCGLPSSYTCDAQFRVDMTDLDCNFGSFSTTNIACFACPGAIGTLTAIGS